LPKSKEWPSGACIDCRPSKSIAHVQLCQWYGIDGAKSLEFVASRLPLGFIAAQALCMIAPSGEVTMRLL